ncbi:guanine nucleotide exchange factor [Anaeramoeba flamelloides]|uniref:Guanine nucleotide exchange factor n=1 Tax=Anaeramoeba flamelloides TaxID=1746091 RepID=A0ABQ8YLY5_9EUKA|nr:guanine nucleotide exchange factor [Anaeramoeba flamelloides]
MDFDDLTNTQLKMVVLVFYQQHLKNITQIKFLNNYISQQKHKYIEKISLYHETIKKLEKSKTKKQLVLQNYQSVQSRNSFLTHEIYLLKNENEKLELQQQNHEAEIFERIEKKLTDYKEYKVMLLNRIDKLKKNNEEMKKQMLKEKKLCKELEKELLNENLNLKEEKRIEINEKNKQIVLLENQIQEIGLQRQHAIEDYKKEKQNFHEYREQSVNTESIFSQKLLNKINEIETLQKTLKISMKSKDNNRKQKQLLNQINKLSQKNTELNIDNREIQRVFKENVQKYQDEITEIKKKKDDQIELLTQTIKDLRSSRSGKIVNDLNKKIEILQLTNSELREEVGYLSRELTASSGQTRDLETENEILKASLEEMSKGNMQLTKRNSILRTNYLTQQSLITVLKHKLESKKEKSNKLKILNKDLEKLQKNYIEICLKNKTKNFYIEHIEKQHNLFRNFIELLVKIMYKSFEKKDLNDETLQKIINFHDQLKKKSDEFSNKNKKICNLAINNDPKRTNNDKIFNFDKINIKIENLKNIPWLIFSFQEIQNINLIDLNKLYKKSKSSINRYNSLDINSEIQKRVAKKIDTILPMYFMISETNTDNNNCKESINDNDESDVNNNNNNNNHNNNYNEVTKEKDSIQNILKNLINKFQKEENLRKRNQNLLKTNLNLFVKLDLIQKEIQKIKRKEKIKLLNSKKKIEKLNKRVQLLQNLNPIEPNLNQLENLSHHTQQLVHELTKNENVKPKVDKKILDLHDPNGLILEETETEIKIKAANLTNLLKLLTNPKNTIPSYQISFLMTYRKFTTPEIVLAFLIRTFQKTIKQKNYLNDPELVQSKILTFLFIWIKIFYCDFEDKPNLTKQLNRFLNSAQETKFNDCKELVTEIKRRFLIKIRGNIPKKEKLLSHVIDESTAKPILPKKISMTQYMDLLDFSPIEMARQLTIYEMDLFQKINLKEFFNKSWSKKDKTLTPNLINFIDHFNKTAQWIITCILKEDKIRTRATIIKKVLEMCNECKLLGNLNSLTELMSGLHHASIRRLSKTWGRLLLNEKRQFEDFSSIISVRKNFSNLRKFIDQRVDKPVLPYVGLYLTDLTFIEEGNPDICDNSLINFSKQILIAKILKKIRNFQEKSFNIQIIPQFQDCFSNLKYQSDEHLLYEKSLKLEPRIH